MKTPFICKDCLCKFYFENGTATNTCPSCGSNNFRRPAEGFDVNWGMDLTENEDDDFDDLMFGSEFGFFPGLF